MIDIFNNSLPSLLSVNEVLNLIKTLNNDERVNGLLTFMPLPRHIDTRKVVNAIVPETDVVTGRALIRSAGSRLMSQQRSFSRPDSRSPSGPPFLPAPPTA